MWVLRKEVIRKRVGHRTSSKGAYFRSDASTRTDLSASMEGNAACTTAVWKVLGSRRICSCTGVGVAMRILITSTSGRAPRACTQLLCGSTDGSTLCGSTMNVACKLVTGNILVNAIVHYQDHEHNIQLCTAAKGGISSGSHQYPSPCLPMNIAPKLCCC